MNRTFHALADGLVPSGSLKPTRFKPVGKSSAESESADSRTASDRFEAGSRVVIGCFEVPSAAVVASCFEVGDWVRALAVRIAGMSS